MYGILSAMPFQHWLNTHLGHSADRFGGQGMGLIRSARTDSRRRRDQLVCAWDLMFDGMAHASVEAGDGVLSFRARAKVEAGRNRYS